MYGPFKWAVHIKVSDWNVKVRTYLVCLLSMLLMKEVLSSNTVYLYYFVCSIAYRICRDLAMVNIGNRYINKSVTWLTGDTRPGTLQIDGKYFILHFNIVFVLHNKKYSIFYWKTDFILSSSLKSHKITCLNALLGLIKR